MTFNFKFSSTILLKRLSVYVQIKYTDRKNRIRDDKAANAKFMVKKGLFQTEKYLHQFLHLE